MAVITIFLALTGLFPGLEVSPYVAGDVLLVPELDDPSSVSTGGLSSQIPFKLMVPCRSFCSKSAFKHQLPCS